VEPQVGLNFAVRAVGLDRGCFRCLDMTAGLLYQSGRFAEALAEGEKALALLRDGARAPQLRARVARYREAARAHPTP
jgi:hypothetical protein